MAFQGSCPMGTLGCHIPSLKAHSESGLVFGHLAQSLQAAWTFNPLFLKKLNSWPHFLPPDHSGTNAKQA